jgi:pimeloyl-ACP methyl ester carboxylesterase
LRIDLTSARFFAENSVEQVGDILMRRILAAIVAAFFFVASVHAAESKQEPKHDFFTTSDGVKIHYMMLGSKGSWVVLIHGYTDTAERMFFKTGIAEALAVNHRVVALDNRNHGMSDKPEAHGAGRAEDTIELMDHLKIQKAHIHGYSMGGGFVGRLMASHPERFITAIFGGSGIGETDDALRAAAVAMDPPMPEPQGAEAAAFKNLRDSSSAARTQSQATTPNATPTSASTTPAAPRTTLVIDLKSIHFPVLAINGEYDRPYSKTHRLWRELANFQNVIIPKKNHVGAIMVGGPMPPEYIDALTKFITANDVR